MENPTKFRTNVILIHGLMRTFLSMRHLGKKLAADGHNVLNYSYPSIRHGLLDHANLLDSFIQARLDPAAPISFVTHSLGCIILRKFALEHGSQYKLQRAVMLGPPNQGSGLAKALHSYTPLARLLGPSFIELTDLKLAPATDLLEVGIIAGGRGKKKGYPPYAVADSDGIVTVEESKLPGMKDHLVIPFVHSFLMYHPEVIRQTRCFLSTGEFAR